VTRDIKKSYIIYIQQILTSYIIFFADLATWHSQRCCEELVAAGAIDTLLRLIRLISRSIPDQEVLKHVLSTLRNLAHYPHLLEVVIQRQGSIQTIVLELLRFQYFVVVSH